METEKKQPTLPYVSYPTFKSFIGHLHDTVVTDQIDNTMMPTTFSGGSRAAVVSALKSLGLIDDFSNTTQELKDFAAAYNSKDWPEAVRTHILSALVYEPISKNIDLKSATRKQIEGLFEDASTQMRDKYIRFFLSANKDAGIEYSPHLKIRRSKGTGTRKRSSTPKPKFPKHTEKPLDETPDAEIKPEGAFDQPIPIASIFPCYIRVPRNITPDQVGMVEAAVAFIKAMAEQNKKSK